MSTNSYKAFNAISLCHWLQTNQPQNPHDGYSLCFERRSDTILLKLILPFKNLVLQTAKLTALACQDRFHL